MHLHTCIHTYPELDVFGDEVLRVHSNGGTLVGFEQDILVIKVSSFVAPLDDGVILAIAPECDIWL